MSEAKPQEDPGGGIFFGGTAMIGVFSAASWAVLHFVGSGVTVVFWLPVLIGIGVTLVGFYSGLNGASGWKQRTWRFFIFTITLAVVGPVVVYFYVEVINYPQSSLLLKWVTEIVGRL